MTAALGAISGFVLLLAGAVADALLAALVALAAGALATLAWYVVVEGAPPLAPVFAAWRDDAPIALGLFLPPALIVLVALGAGASRFIGACWDGLLGGQPLRWVPRLRRLFSGRAG
jgi:hypothetical protein